MVKIALIKFESNIAASIAGAKRENFKKGDKIVVSESEMIMLMRLGCKVIGKFTLDYKANKKIVDELVKAGLSKAEKEKAQKEPIVETNEEEKEDDEETEDETEDGDDSENTGDDQNGNAPDEKPQV